MPGDHLIDEDAQHVHRGEQQVLERREIAQEATAQRPEDLLEGVGQLRHPGMADRRGRALERMRGSEDLGEGLVVRGIPLELKEAALDPFDLLRRLGEIDDVVAWLEIEGEIHASAIGPPAG